MSKTRNLRCRHPRRQPGAEGKTVMKKCGITYTQREWMSVQKCKELWGRHPASSGGKQGQSLNGLLKEGMQGSWAVVKVGGIVQGAFKNNVMSMPPWQCGQIRCSQAAAATACFSSPQRSRGATAPAPANGCTPARSTGTPPVRRGWQRRWRRPWCQPHSC